MNIDSVERFWDDSNERLFTQNWLGRVNFAGGWDMANLLRYATAANALYKLRKPAITDKINVLDLGCSYASFVTFFNCSYAKPGRPRINYTGLEVREDVVDKTNELYHGGTECCTVNLHKFDAMKQNMSKFGNSFDMILLQEVLEHIGEKACRKILKSASSMICNEGIVVVSSPNPKKHEGEEFVWPENHAYEFRLDEMLKEIDAAGLRSYQITGWLAKAVPLKQQLSGEQRKMYDRLNTVSSGFATATMAIMYPELARCYTIICCKRECNDYPILSEAVLNSYMPYKLTKGKLNVD